MPLISSVEFVFGKPGIPAEKAIPKFPINTLIPYYGADPGLTGWTRYSNADGYYLAATRTENLVGTRTAATAYSGGTFSPSIGSSGSHTATTAEQWLKTTAGTVYVDNSSAGSHSHTAYGASSGMGSPESMLSRQEITFLKSTAEQTELPANSLVFSSTQPTNSTAFGSTNNRYLKGSASTLNYTAGTTQYVSGSETTSTDGGHTHGGTTRYTAWPYYPSGYFRQYEMSADGYHSHTVSYSGSQSSINSVLLKLWQMAASFTPTTDTIAMYVGSIAALPLPWRLCDGLNNTVNIPQTVIGYNTTTGWNVLVSTDANYSVTGMSTNSLAHAHTYSLRATSTNVAGPAAYHKSYTWSHTHTISAGSYATAYRPPVVNVAFIQYKG